MKKHIKFLVILFISVSIFISSCSAGKQKPDAVRETARGVTANQKDISTNTSSMTATPAKTTAYVSAIDLAQVKPNEAGRIMVVMFHNFVESFTPSATDDGQYTTTFDEFRKLLQILYDKGYRLINLNDYLNNNIDVPAGCIPMIFTFDDGTAGQFNLIENNGRLEVNPQSAVGIMEQFNKTHPDFGLKGTFYINLGLKVFEGKGSVAERLQYLIDKGFEIGNHTYTHINMTKVDSSDKIQQEVGANQKRMYELIPGYSMKSLALPFGAAPSNLRDYVAKGTYDGIEYENLAILEVGAGPTVSPVSRFSTPLSMSRVRATGIKKVDCDLDWWLKNIARSDEYISDGNPDTVTVPKSKEDSVDKSRLKGKSLVIY